MPYPSNVPISIIPPVSQGVGPLVWRNGSQIARLTTPLNPSFLVYDGSKTAWGDGSAGAPVLLPNLQQVAGSTINFAVGLNTSGQLAAYANTTINPNNAFVTATGSTTARTLENRFADVVNVKDFGAKGDGVTDDTAAIQAAIYSVISNGGQIYFPNGTYILSNSITVNYPNTPTNITLVGVGANSTTLQWTNASGGIGFVFNSPHNTITINDIAFSTTRQNGGNAITLFQNSSFDSNYAVSNITNCVFRGSNGYSNNYPTSLGFNYWSIGIFQNQKSGLNITNCHFIGGSDSSGRQGIGLKFQGTGPNPPVQTEVVSSLFIYLYAGIYMQSYHQGLAVATTNFVNNTFGITQPLGQVSNAQISISASQFDSDCCIYLASGCVGTLISSSYFIARGNAPVGAICILIDGTYNYSITGNYFESLWPPNSAIVIGARTAGSGTITNNVMNNFSTGINLQPNSSLISVQGNVFDNNQGTNIIDTGINNYIVNNQGYNPIGSSSVTVGSSPFTYTCGSTPTILSIRGGTVSSVVSDGITLFSSTNCSVSLGVGKSVTITYSSAPTITQTIS
jgi:hypothetical protein